jgi:hypothetical protein
MFSSGFRCFRAAAAAASLSAARAFDLVTDLSVCRRSIPVACVIGIGISGSIRSSSSLTVTISHHSQRYIGGIVVV